MSTTLIITPQPPVTSTGTLNIWIVVITAILFFIILAWYNTLVAIYNYAIGNNPNQIKNYNEINKFTMIGSIGYASLWTIIAIGIYYLLLNAGKLSGGGIDTLPLLRAETRDINHASPSGALVPV
jgi:hypothetical protein